MRRIECTPATYLPIVSETPSKNLKQQLGLVILSDGSDLERTMKYLETLSTSNIVLNEVQNKIARDVCSGLE